MKKTILLLWISVSLTAYSQSVTLTPGSILPQMTSNQRTALANPSNGMLVYDTGSNSYWFYQQNAWKELPSGNHWQLNGTAGTEIKSTNSGGFWSENANGLDLNADNNSNPPTSPTNGNGTRLMWIPSRSAFRAGSVAEGYKSWDADSIGLFSFAAGYNSKAKGFNATALGGYTQATGYYATALGGGGIASGEFSLATGLNSRASGTASTAGGINTVASGNASTALGVGSKAIGKSSMALGNYVESTGDSSTAFGTRTLASGIYSTALGYKSAAAGNSSVSMGNDASASGDYALASGLLTLASGQASTAQGYSTSAIGNSSFAIGRNTTAHAFAAAAIGNRTEAKAINSLSIGSYNDVQDSPNLNLEAQTDRIFQIGNGYYDFFNVFEVRKNALTVLRNGNTGINTASPQSMLHINGFTKLGDDAPKIKIKKITGQTANSQNGMVGLSHLLNSEKIISVNVMVEYNTIDHLYVPHAYTTESSYEFSYQVTNNEIVVKNKDGNSSQILNKPIKILITYEE